MIKLPFIDRRRCSSHAKGSFVYYRSRTRTWRRGLPWSDSRTRVCGRYCSRTHGRGWSYIYSVSRKMK